MSVYLGPDPREVVRVNDAHRHAGVTGDIHTLEDVEGAVRASGAAVYAFRVPTLVPDQWGQRTLLASSTYKSAFGDKFPIAEAVLNWALETGRKVVVAGGAAAWPLGAS